MNDILAGILSLHVHVSAEQKSGYNIVLVHVYFKLLKIIIQ